MPQVYGLGMARSEQQTLHSTRYPLSALDECARGAPRGD